MARGETIRQLYDGFLPRQVPIESYGRGGFRFGDMSHIGGILALPSGMKAWAIHDPAALDVEAFAPLWPEQKAIDVLLVGTGARMAALGEALRWRLREAGIAADVMPTGLAATTYNLLLEEGRRVAAALIAID